MDIEVRPLAAAQLDAADGIIRSAFDAYFTTDVFGDTDLLHTRFRAPHTAVLAAYADDELAGSTVVTRWGSVSYFGPLAVVPQLWGGGLGTQLIEAALEVFDGWGTTHHGLLTFPQSPRHLELYQRFGFWPRFLTAIMSCPVGDPAPALGWRLSATAPAARSELVDACAAVTGAIMPGLDVRGEIAAVLDQGLGEVLLVGEPEAPSGFAVCHSGPGTEAGTAVTYVKFAAVRPGPGDVDAFASLVQACRGHAADVGTRRLVVGVNTARHDAYRHLLATGFHTDTPGVTMHRPNEPAYDRYDVHVLDDWR